MAGLLGLTLVTAVVVSSAGRELQQVRLTDRSVFRVSLARHVVPVSIGGDPSWRVHLADPDSTPVSHALMDVSGDVADHEGNRSTRPRVVEADTPGDYALVGLRSSTTGRRRLALAIRTPDGRSDTITFKLVL